MATKAELEARIEKAILVYKDQAKELAMLKEQNASLKKEIATQKRINVKVRNMLKVQ
jgi:hypothetical protein